MISKKIEKVKNFWEDHLCGSHFINDDYLSAKFFENYTAYRYQKEHHLLQIIDWESAVNKEVLEIGLGVGSDATRWANYARKYTGIDLTEEAVEATKIHLSLKGLQANVFQANAEEMPFQDNQFDIVYSHGVLHHTENIENTFREISRVLKPEGQFIIMLYTKDSFNYWIRIQFYFRLRFLVEFLKIKLGFSLSEHWKLHMKEREKMGWKYLSWKEFPHHCTDGPECSIANIYYPSEIKQLLKKYQLEVNDSVKTHFPIFKGRKFRKLELNLARYLGFFRFYFGKNNKAK